jgi:hypothetical protein
MYAQQHGPYDASRCGFGMAQAVHGRRAHSQAPPVTADAFHSSGSGHDTLFAAASPFQDDVDAGFPAYPGAAGAARAPGHAAGAGFARAVSDGPHARMLQPPIDDTFARPLQHARPLSSGAIAGRPCDGAAEHSQRDWLWRGDEPWTRTDSNASSAWQSAGMPAAASMPAPRGRSAGCVHAWGDDDAASRPRSSRPSPRHVSPNLFSPRHRSPHAYGALSPASGRSRGRSPDTDGGAMSPMPRSPPPRLPAHPRSPPLPLSPTSSTHAHARSYSHSQGHGHPPLPAGRAYGGAPAPRSAPGPASPYEPPARALQQQQYYGHAPAQHSRHHLYGSATWGGPSSQPASMPGAGAQVSAPRALLTPRVFAPSRASSAHHSGGVASARASVCLN